MEGPYLKELELDHSRLGFANKRLETEYRAHLVNRERRTLRVQLLTGVLLVCSIMLLDHFLLGPQFSDRSIVLRLVFMLLPLLALFALTWSRQLVRWVQPLGVLCALGVGLTSLALGALAARYNEPRVFGGYQVIIVFVYFFLGLRVPVAVATAMFLFFAYLLAAVLATAPPTSTLYNGLYLLALNIIGATGVYQLDKSRRIEFLEERVLNYRANHDALTSLPNRRAFDELLEKMWDSAASMRCPIAVMLMDIDHFKAYNDHYGHQAGDRTIREVAAVLQANLRRPQDFAGRYGGEEFVVLLFDTSKEHALELANGIRQQILAKNIEHQRSDVARCVSVSIGLSHLLPHESRRSARGFVQSADQALYAAKQNGRNCVVDADLSVSTTTTGVFRVMQLGDRQTARVGTDAG